MALGPSLLPFDASASVWLMALKGGDPKGEGQMPASLPEDVMQDADILLSLLIGVLICGMCENK